MLWYLCLGGLLILGLSSAWAGRAVPPPPQPAAPPAFNSTLITPERIF